MNTPFTKKGVARAVGGALMAGGAALLITGMFVPSASAALTGIADTKHNLSVNGTGPAHLDPAGAVTTTQICVFCHTPHGARVSVQAPLWNKITNAPSTYTTYDKLGTSTLHGTVLTVGSVSLACLSCHDGTAALNVMINAPGSGGYNPTVRTTFGTMTGTDVDPATGKLVSGIIANLGVDLRNDHPVGIEYGGGLVTPGSTTSDINLPKDFHGTGYSKADELLQSGTVNLQPVWWVDTPGGTTGTRDKTDIMLYTRDNTGNEPFVECASCHDPHSTNTTFLRVANTGSSLCLSCHIK